MKYKDNVLSIKKSSFLSLLFNYKIIYYKNTNYE